MWGTQNFLHWIFERGCERNDARIGNKSWKPQTFAQLPSSFLTSNLWLGVGQRNSGTALYKWALWLEAHFQTVCKGANFPLCVSDEVFIFSLKLREHRKVFRWALQYHNQLGWFSELGWGFGKEITLHSSKKLIFPVYFWRTNFHLLCFFVLMLNSCLDF